MNQFVIGDLCSTQLTDVDKEILQYPNLAGLFLFARNFESKEQITALLEAVRDLRDDLVIFIDHEGGRVQRFTNGFTRLKAMRYFTDLYDQDPDLGVGSLYEQLQVMLRELRAVGIDASAVPVLDCDIGISTIIGDRSFSADPEKVAYFGSVVLEALHDMGGIAIGKHFPGHGGVKADSHLELPVDDRLWDTLWVQDLVPFRQLASRLDAIMPAHMVYSAVDSLPASFSSYWLKEVLRNRLNFQGVVMSDDISMAGAVAMGGVVERSMKMLEAGCDMILSCNNSAQLKEVLESIPKHPSQESLQRNDLFISKSRLWRYATSEVAG